MRVQETLSQVYAHADQHAHEQGGEERGTGGAYSFVACLSHLTIEHASLSKKHTEYEGSYVADIFFFFSSSSGGWGKIKL